MASSRYWAKIQRQNSVKCNKPSLSIWRSAAPWVRRDTKNGKAALQPHSERPGTPWSQSRLPSLAGELQSHPGYCERGHSTSIPPDNAQLVSGAVLLGLELQIQNRKIEKRAGWLKAESSTKNYYPSLYFWPRLLWHFQVPKADHLILFCCEACVQTVDWSTPWLVTQLLTPAPASWHKVGLFSMKLKMHVWTCVSECVYT